MKWWHTRSEVLWENPVPGIIFPPQIPHGLLWDWNRITVVRSLWLIAELLFSTGKMQNVMEVNLLIPTCSLQKSAACPLISGKLMEIYCKYEDSETFINCSFTHCFSRKIINFFLTPHKSSTQTKYNYIRCAIPQSVGLPHQSLRILSPDPQYSWNDCFWQKK